MGLLVHNTDSRVDTNCLIFASPLVKDILNNEGHAEDAYTESFLRNYRDSKSWKMDSDWVFLRTVHASNEYWCSCPFKCT